MPHGKFGECIMKRFEIVSTNFDEIICLRRKVFYDERGYFSRLFSKEELADLGWDSSVSQINISKTRKAGTVRGLHYQKAPGDEKKLVTCIAGQIQDFIVDVRPDSKRYLNTFTLTLSEENNISVVIPEGFAHGFQSLTNDAIIIYAHSASYNPDYEMGLNILDPIIGINLPLPVVEISSRDKNHPLLIIN